MTTTKPTAAVPGVEDIAFIGDLHLSFTIWERYRAITGDSQFSLDEIIRTVDEAGIRHLVLLGDIFDTTEPHPALVKMFRRFLESCSCAGIRVYYIQGNHDRRVVPWPTAVSGDIIWIGGGEPTTIAGRSVTGFDYMARDAAAEAMAKLGANSGASVDILCLHQACRQYLDIEGCWNFDLEWVPDNVQDVFMGDIHEPWSAEVGNHGCWYSGAGHTRSITEAKHAKSVLVRRADGSTDRLQFRCRPIKAFAIDDTTKDTSLAEMRNWLAEKVAQEPPLPPVIYLTYDVAVSAAPEMAEDVIKSMGAEAYVMARSVGSRAIEGVDFDPTASLDEIPSVQGFVEGFFNPDTAAFEHGFAVDLLDGTQGKEGMIDKIALARQRFIQGISPNAPLPTVGPDHFERRDAQSGRAGEGLFA